MKRILLVYGGQSGKTQRLADAVAAGVGACAEVELCVRKALEADIDDLLRADGLLIGTPENFGYMSGAVKDFMDRTYYPAEGKTTGRPYALFVSAGNDGTGAVRAIERIANGYGWTRVAEPLIIIGEPGEEALDRARELGEALATGVALGIF